MKKLFMAVFVIATVIACKKEASNPTFAEKDYIKKNKDSIFSVQKNIDKETVIKQLNDEILKSLKEKDYASFASLIHPEKGIRFSMYAYVNTKEDKHFSKKDFENYQSSKTLFIWGRQDGTGHLYKATIKDYLGKWVFSKDFTISEYSLNKFKAGGNSLNNLKEIYPNKDFTENYIEGTEEYCGMDWGTLRLVFEEFQGKYYLLAVINDRWTT